MNVQDVVEEIQEKSQNFLSVPSILRKITNVRDNLIRNYGPAQQQSNPIVTELDLLKDVAQYPLPCPPGNIVDVEVRGLWYGLCGGYYYDCQPNWVQPVTYNTGTISNEVSTVVDVPNCWFRMPYRQFDEHYYGPYYYFLSGTIGLVPKPCQDVQRGLKIFHIPVLAQLTVENLNGPTGFDPHFDMVLVYGVLKEIVSGPQSSEYAEKYQKWVYDYQTANSGWERYVVNERW
ncbi:phage adaptor protein [Paenibacillus oleatilyticus]|uniref:Uncharacterized protein n=1 Tax=Paenibacillus oleatilyticus TaxID=2594886 RepID=A0ABV4VCG6_9BACL